MTRSTPISSLPINEVELQSNNTDYEKILSQVNQEVEAAKMIPPQSQQHQPQQYTYSVPNPKIYHREEEGFDYYTELKEPVIIAIIFFVLNQKNIISYLCDKLPYMFTDSGDISVYNILIRAIIMGFLFYIIKKFLL